MKPFMKSIPTDMEVDLLQKIIQEEVARELESHPDHRVITQKFIEGLITEGLSKELVEAWQRKYTVVEEQ